MNLITIMEHNIQNTNLENYFIDVGLKCLFGGIVVIIYIIGAYLHIKLIKTSKNDKSMTWMMDIANSIYMLCHKAHLIIIYILTYMIDDLYKYTGSWFCYSSKALAIIGNGNVSGHGSASGAAVLDFGVRCPAGTSRGTNGN